MAILAERRLKTYMAQVFYKCPGSRNPMPLKGQRVDARDESEVFLLDDLLGGGIVIPEDIVQERLGKLGNGILGNQPNTTPGLLMLVTGAPGSGKTTFALELCYRLSFSDNSQFHKNFANGVSSLYFSAEASAKSIVQNAISYGWKDSYFILPGTQQQVNLKSPRVFLWGKKECIEKDITPENELERVSDEFLSQYSGEKRLAKQNRSSSTILRPQIFVIDSFNALSKEDAPKSLSTILQKCASQFLLTIAIMDTGPGISPDHRWVPSEYLADIEIDFSYDRPENYMIRRLWVVKARFQDHADGWHRMKINPRPTPEAVPNPLNPVIKEGGIFVFPSVHRHLSLARGELDNAKAGSKTPVRHPFPIETPFRALTAAIQGNGFPAGACTCIVGDRGGMKSHLAYYTLLKFLEDFKDQRGIILSLRDTEDAATDTLAEILVQQVSDEGKRLVPSLDTKAKALKHIREQLIDRDRLEVLYFWPGYISPEEFFHLVCTSIDRPGEGLGRTRTEPASLLVINGLEQLSSRFPLCAKERMFISGLLSVLTVKGVTVLITSGGHAGLPPEQGGVPAGLLPTSDLIIQTSFRLLPAERIWSSGVWFPTLPALEKYENPIADIVAQRERTAKGEEPHVVYEIVREPGARECRRRVLFYMGRDGDPLGEQTAGERNSGFVRGSVYVRPLPDEFPHGERPQ